MKSLLLSALTFSLLLIGTSVILTNAAFGQNPKQEKMALLNYMIGDWVGTSTAYENGSVTREVPAYESIQYSLDQHIITIDLKSETLVLHTVIYYDDKDKTYYYNPFSQRGAGKYPATFSDGKLIVTPNDDVRYIFTSTPEGNFQEYGEKRIEGKWVKYFEDNFERIPR